MHETPLDRIAWVGDYVPRRCGIATFTRDLRSAVAAHLPGAACPVVAMNDGPAGHDYPAEVAFECRDDDPTAYRRAADFLNLLEPDVVSLQHEYGIYGGPSGSHVLGLLQRLRSPVHTTLHTVLARPTPEQREVLADVIRLSARVAVMTERGRTLLHEVYGVPADRVDVIPHGIPEMEFIDPNFHKDRFGVAGRSVLLTFGLLSPGKGVEHVIAALPDIVARHPDVAYLVLGATHPHLIRTEGERYREELVRQAAELGVERHVVFHDRYVEMPELLAFLGAADVYLTPYLNEDQITSGTLAYAFGCGKAVLSTPYWHARELLAEGRGVLVPFRDPAAIAAGVVELLADDLRRHAMRKRAFLLGRDMIWPRVAARYAEAFRKARCGTAVRLRHGVATRPESPPRRTLPAPALGHLWRLMDSTGVFQHALYDIPDADHGYCTDDTARALALLVALEDLDAEIPEVVQAATVCATFLGHAFVPASGRFRNLLGFDRRWRDDSGSDDCLGRAVLALGTCVGRSRRSGLRRWAMRFLGPAVAALEACSSPRAWATGLLGIHDHLDRLGGDRHLAATAARLTGRLLDLQRSTAGDGWPWLEDALAYDNARICQAIIATGRRTGDRQALATGLEMLAWLTDLQRSSTGRFQPVGSRGFARRGGPAAAFDQQPLEAHGMVAASIEAFRATGDACWVDAAWTAFDWFAGYNVLGLALCDPRTGGCRDGLLEDRTNDNMGAESTLAYLAALVEMRALDPATPVAGRGRPGCRRAAGIEGG
jgi:glycosyltransferase involved in cell wall biosynthesis